MWRPPFVYSPGAPVCLGRGGVRGKASSLLIVFWALIVVGYFCNSVPEEHRICGRKFLFVFSLSLFPATILWGRRG